MMEILILMVAAVPGLLWIVDGYRSQTEARRPFVPMTAAQDAAITKAFRRAFAERETMTATDVAHVEALRRALAR